MTDSALSYLQSSRGWAIGTGPSVVVVDQGVARSLTTTSLRADVYAFVFDQRGPDGGNRHRGLQDHQDWSGAV